MRNLIGHVGLNTQYHFECWHATHSDGSHCAVPTTCPRNHREVLRWTEDFHNLVVTAGLNKVLDASFKTGLAAPLWYVGMVNNAGFTAYAAADTMAAHGGWTEFTNVVEGTRQAFTPGAIAAGSVDNSASKATYNISGSATVRGAFMADSNTLGGATGTLYGEGDFSSSRAVISGDILRITITLTAVTG